MDQQWQAHTLPAFSLAGSPVVDSTGAGDAFIGGLAAALVRGASVLSALHVAAWTGSMNCLGEGARGGMARLKALSPSGSLDIMPQEILAHWG